MADSSFFVYDESRPVRKQSQSLTHSVKPAHFPLFVTQQNKRKMMFLFELCVRFRRIRAHSYHLGAGLLKNFVAVPERAGFDRASRSEILRIKIEDDDPAGIIFK